MLITTLVVSFCKVGGGNVNVNLWFLMVYVRCEVLCRLDVAGNVFLWILIGGIFYLHIHDLQGGFVQKIQSVSDNEFSGNFVMKYQTSVLVFIF